MERLWPLPCSKSDPGEFNSMIFDATILRGSNPSFYP
jgi:hypothetical protein